MSKQNKFEALEAIKRGAKKQEFKEILEKQKSSGAAGYQIPEPKKKNYPRKSGDQIEQVHKVPVKDIAPPIAKGSGELDAIEQMFSDSPSMAVVPTSAQSHTQIATGESLPIPVGMDGYNAGMPEFNPLEKFKEKMAQKKKTESIHSTQNSDVEFEKVEGVTDEQSRGQVKEDFKRQQDPQMNYYHLKDMITDIATDVSKKQIVEILESYAKKQKSKKTFEIYNKEKNIIKIDNKLYQLNEVKLKPKN